MVNGNGFNDDVKVTFKGVGDCYITERTGPSSLKCVAPAATGSIPVSIFYHDQEVSCGNAVYSTAKTVSISAVSKSSVVAAPSFSVDYSGAPAITSATLVSNSDPSVFFTGVVSGTSVTYANVTVGDYSTNLDAGSGFATFSPASARILSVTLPTISALATVNSGYNGGAFINIPGSG